MKTIHFISLIFSLTFLLSSCSTSETKYKYESVTGDPFKTRIYTLDNGLKVYLAVNKDKPRVQTYIGVKVGGKNDPAETTGLAHYFEHLMFKGTQSFGTTDYAKEKVYLDQIEGLYETYRRTMDEEERKNIYADIDSISQIASQIAIPNEYDKLMSAIGSTGTNAFTSYDVTAYIENIPANEIENWAIIQADRFTNPVLRLFHTELETVYEEYNMSLTRDGRKVYETMLQNLFPHHPYGTQTVLGTAEHLKNPSIKNIKEYFETYYVPNNMAICMAGDLNPEETIKIIDKYFGSMEPKEVPELKTDPEPAIRQPIRKEVIGLEAENLTIAYRMPAANTKDVAILELMDYLLTNGTAGLIDLNLVQKQKILRAGSGVIPMSDYSVFQMYGTPKEGQTLEEVRDMLLGQLDMVKKGEFEDWLMEAVINNFKLRQYYQQQSPEYIANMLLYSFTNNKDWKDEVNKLKFQSSLRKQDIVDFCNKYFADNYVIIYKKQGKPDINKIDKPQITPIATNRDNESDFLAKIRTRDVQPIDPVFIDYSKDLSILKAKKDIEVLYKQNETNPLFSMYYVYDMGNNHDKALGTAFSYLNYLGTSKQSAEEIKSELYKIGCSFGVHASEDKVQVYVSGLSDNFERAMELLEERLADAVADQDAYKNLAADILKSRSDAKLNQSTNFSRLTNYATWGPKSPATHILSAKELNAMNPEELVRKTKELKYYPHKILYYGPLRHKEIIESINRKHAIADELRTIPEPEKFEEQETKQTSVLLAHYDAKQIYMAMRYKGIPYNQSIETISTLYNNYFGGGMNSIVFQEMREARGLAYSASAGYYRPSKPERSYSLSTFIATQEDKMMDAIDAFNDILNNMPESEKAFNLAKESIITNIRTQRILRESILWNYVNAVEFGYDKDKRIELFEKIPGMTLDNVKAFQEEYIKDKPRTYCILGDLQTLDIKSLEKLGTVHTLSSEEIFGY